MLGWAVVFFVIAVMAAFLGFGGVATAFAGVARSAFFAAVILLLLSLVLSVFPRARIAGGARGLGVLALGAVIGIGVYLWFAHDMSAERVGREIDRGAVDLVDATETAADRTAVFVDETVDDTRSEAADAIEPESK